MCLARLVHGFIISSARLLTAARSEPSECDEESLKRPEQKSRIIWSKHDRTSFRKEKGKCSENFRVRGALAPDTRDSENHEGERRPFLPFCKTHGVYVKNMCRPHV